MSVFKAWLAFERLRPVAAVVLCTMLCDVSKLGNRSFECIAQASVWIHDVAARSRIYETYEEEYQALRDAPSGAAKWLFTALNAVADASLKFFTGVALREDAPWDLKAWK